MEKKKISSKGIIAIALAAVLTAAAGLIAIFLPGADVKIQEVPTTDVYGYATPQGTKAQPDEGMIIDGVLDEAVYQNNNWLYLHNDDGGNHVSIAMTSYFGDKGMYFVYDVTETVPIYVNLQRASYLNSCIEMYFAPSSVTSLKENSYFEVDMMPTGDMVFKKSNGKGGYVNVATTDDKMAVLGATTKGGPVNTEECYGYNLELFIPWEYMNWLGLDAEAMKSGFIYVDPAHITSKNFTGTDTSVDRYWYFYAQQQGAGFSDVYQYFRFNGDGIMGTVPVTLTGDAHCTVAGDKSIIPGMQTTVTVTPEDGYAITSITVNGQEMIEKVSFNADGSVDLITRGQKDGLTVTAATEAVSAGNKTLKGTVTLAKPGGDSLDGVRMIYSGPTGDKPLSFDENGNFEIADAAQGHYVIKAEKDGYTALSQGVYLNRDMTVSITLQYNTFYSEKGTCWLLDQQNENVLRKFGGSGYLLSTDSYNKFTFSANFFYDEALPEEADTNYFTQQRSGMRICFSNGKYWHIDLLKENGKYIVQYAKHSGDGSVFKWKEICVLNEDQIARYTSEQGIKLTLQRDGQYAAIWLEDSLISVEKLDDAYAACTAQLGFESWVANRTVQDIPYAILDSNSVNLRNLAFRKEGKWDISGIFQNYLTSPASVGDTGWIWTYDTDYRDITLHVADATPRKNNFKMAVHFKFNNGEDFRIGLTNADTGALGTYKIQVLDNNSIVKNWRTHYVLSEAEVAKLTGKAGMDFRVAIVGDQAIVYLDNVQVCAIDLSKDLDGNKTGIHKTAAQIGIRLYGNEGNSSKVSYDLGGKVKTSTIQVVEPGQVRVAGTSHVIGETIVLTPPDEGCRFVSVTVDGKNVKLTDLTRYTFTATASKHTVSAVSTRVYDWDPTAQTAKGWDVSQQDSGILGKNAACSDTDWLWTYDSSYRDISLTVSDKTPDANDFRAGIHFAFTDGNAFRVSLTNADSGELGTYKLQLMSGNTNVTDWDGASVKNWATAYRLTAEEAAKVKADGLTFRAVILGESVNLYLDGKLAASYALPGIGDADAKIAVRIYGNSGVQQDMPYMLGAEPDYHTLSIADHENGKVKANAKHYLPGDTVVLSVAGNAGFAHDSFTVDGAAAMTDHAGNYSFVIQKDTAIAATFKKSLFKPTVTGWALENQHYGKLQVVYTNANGNANWLDFADSYGDVDITLVAREYPDTEKPDLTRSAIRFMFGDKNITFSIAKNKDGEGHKYSIQSLAGDNIVAANYDFYVLNQAQIDKFNSAEGISLRVIRQGTLVDIYLDGVQVVDAFDLTQNSSGVTADSQVNLTIRRYDDPNIHAEYGLSISATAPQTAKIQLPTMKEGTVTTDMKTYLVGEKVTVTVKANTGYAIDTLTVNGKTETLGADGRLTFVAQAENTLTATFRTIVFAAGGDWDISQQESGILKIANSDGDSGWVETNRKDYQNVDFRLTLRDQKNADDNFRAAVRLYFQNGQYVSFTVTNDRANDDATTVYELQTMGGTILNWKFLGYTLTQEQVAALTGTQGLEFRVVRAGTYAHIYLGGVHVYEYDLGSAVESQPTSVLVRYYGNSGLALEVPFSLSEDVEEAGIAVSAGDNGKITTQRQHYLVGETVALTVAGNEGFAHDSFTVNGDAAVTDNAGAYSFVAKAQNTVAATFKKSLFKTTVTGWALENQHYGKLQVIYTNANGNSNWLDFADSYGDVDITLVAREYPDTAKPDLTRSAIRFMFGSKNITFSIAKNTVSGGGYKYSVQSLAGDNIVAANYDFYVLNQAQIDKFNSAEGIALRVVRQGVLVDIYLDGVLVVDDFDLTQNSSGVTADSQVNLTIRRFDDPGIDAEYTFTLA